MADMTTGLQSGAFKRARSWIAPVTTVVTFIPQHFMDTTSSTGEVVQGAHASACAALGLQLLFVGGRAVYRKVRNGVTITLGNPNAKGSTTVEEDAPKPVEPESVSEKREHAA